MKDLLNTIQIQVNNSLYSKDPLSTDLGKRILKAGCIKINEVGFETFTFKKLAKELDTAESSIYRYFDNKHNFLIYLLSWYWGCMEYLMVFSCTNISDPKDKLKLAINTLCKPITIPLNNDFIDEESINNIVISESIKSYFTKSVDKENKEGFFVAFKSPCHRLSALILEINSDYKYANSLSSTVVEGIISQKHFDLHLTSLTNFDSTHKGIELFYTDLILKTITK